MNPLARREWYKISYVQVYGEAQMENVAPIIVRLAGRAMP